MEKTCVQEINEPPHILSAPLMWLGGSGFVAQLCLTFYDPWTVVHQASLSMGFSRQEYWSSHFLLYDLSKDSPIFTLWYNSLSTVVLVAKLCLTLCYPLDSSLPGFSVHEISQARILVQVATSFSSDVPNPGVESTSLTLADEFFITESPEKPP